MSTLVPPKIDAPTPPARMRLGYLDGLRGLAALFVMAHHLWRSYTKMALPGLEGFATNWLLYGHLSVDVFIVLSGFCLMLPMARSRSLRGGWQSFYKSRARRILPPLYAAIALAIALSFLSHESVSKSVVLANVLLLQDLWQSKNTLDGPLWSVALEWKIYFLFPVFVWLWLRYGPLAVLLTAGAISAVLYSVIMPLGFITDKTHSCPWYVFLFAMGMVATDFAGRREDAVPRWRMPSLLLGALICLGLILLKWPITSAGEGPLYDPHLPLIDTFTGLATALTLAILGQKSFRNERSLPISLLSWKPLVFVGTIGYSTYLIHILFIYKLEGWLTWHLPVHPFFVVIPLDMAIVVGIAYLFHLAFERPFMSKPGQSAPKTERQAEVAAIVNPAP